MLSWNRRKLPNLLLLFGMLCLPLGTEPGYAQDKSDELKKLLKERRDLLSDAAAQTTEAYLFLKVVTVQAAIQAERDSLMADLDWFEKTDDRIQALEKHKEVADKLLKAADVKVIAGREPKSAGQQAKAYVLEVQIELLKEKEKQKAKPGK
jgi:hypothetical protein